MARWKNGHTCPGVRCSTAMQRHARGAVVQCGGLLQRGQRPLYFASLMLNWSHYKFHQRLLQKAELTAGCTVIMCHEPYTSKTCGACGHIYKNLGGRKVFMCPQVQLHG